MKKLSYGILSILILSLLYLQFFMPISSETSKPTTFQTQQRPAYSKIRPHQNDSLVGTYQTSNSIFGFKDLILDSTYTYRYGIQGNSGETIVLKGSWELSYKGQALHIILHRPLPNKAWQNLELANIEEHRFKVSPNGLKDLYTQEEYLQLETEEYSLAVLK